MGRSSVSEQAVAETSPPLTLFGSPTNLTVDLEVPDECAADMRGMWSEAIVRIRRLPERVYGDET